MYPADADAELVLLRDVARDVVSRHAPDGTVLYVSPAWRRLWPCGPEGLTGRDPAAVLHPADREAARALLGRLRDEGVDTATAQLRVRCCGAPERRLEVTAHAVRDAAGRLTEVHCGSRDVTELHRRLLQQSAVARLGAFALGCADADALRQEAVRVAVEVLGADLALLNVPAEDPGCFRIAGSAGEGAPAAGSITRPALGAQAVLAELREAGAVTVDDLRALPGTAGDPMIDRGLLSGAAVLVGEPEHPVGVLTVHCAGTRRLRSEDLSFLQSIAHVVGAAEARHRAEARRRRSALYDALTGLPNRALLQDRLRHALARARRDGGSVAVLCVGVDHLKVINDSLGYRSGDELLCELAPRLAGAVRAADTVARLGGDEFVVLLDDVVDEADALHAAGRLRAAVGLPVMVAGEPRIVTTSVGVVVAAPGSAHTPEQLMGDAEAAMYLAKERGRDRVEVFDAMLRARAVERLRIQEDLRRALERDELWVAYQPVMQLADGGVRGMEALVRWRHPELGLVPPDRFIPIAEATGLVVPLGAWVLREAVAQLARWRAAGHEQLRVSVNLSARQVEDPGIVGTVRDALDAAGVPAVRLILEITERLLLDESPAVTATLAELQALGVTLILDDFGTGYSSLSYLRRYHLDGLKIDRSFVADLGEDGHGDPAIVAAIVSMAKALGLAVVPEGVETAAQVALLAGLGCSLAQGFHFGRPMTPDDATAFLAAHQTVPQSTSHAIA